MRSSFKRLLCLILCFTLILVLLPVSRVEAAVNDPLQYLTYSVTDGAVTITNCDDTVTGYLEIPDIIEGLPVTTISTGAFAFTNLTAVIIPGSVTYTEDNAFACDSLEAVVFLGDPPSNYWNSFSGYGFWDWEDFRGKAYYPMHNSNWPTDFFDDIPNMDADINPRYWIGIHSWDKGTPTIATTCTSEGRSSHVCTVCGAIGIKEIPAPGHNWDNGTVVFQPTCDQNGIRRYACANCSDSYVADTVSKLGLSGGNPGNRSYLAQGHCYFPAHLFRGWCTSPHLHILLQHQG